MIGFKRLVFLCAAATLAAAGAAGRPVSEAGKESSLPELVVYGLKGPSGVGMIRMFEEPPVAPGFTVRLTSLAQADLMAARLISGEALCGVLPPNVAAKIAASGKPLQTAAVTGNGMLRLLTSEPELQSLEGLAGTTVTAAGQGAVPEYVFRKILSAHGLEPERDVGLDFSLAYPEIAQALIAGRITTALLPEPFATMARQANPALRELCDVQAEWEAAVGAAAGTSFPMTVFVVNADFARENPRAVNALLEAYRLSIAWVEVNPEEAGTLVEKHDLGLKAAVVAAAVPRSAYVFIPAAKARPALERLFSAFLEFDPVSIGGKLPDESFYYTGYAAN